MRENLVVIGGIEVAGVRIKCWRYYRPHGSESLRQALMNSCNPVFIGLGQKLGVETYYNYLEKFKLLEVTGIDLPGEAGSIFLKEEKVGPVELATISFGQRFEITPIQLVTAVSAIANGGTSVKPRVVKQIINRKTNEIKDIPVEKKETVISKEELKKWVDYAIENNSVILYDAAYEAYIQDEDIPHSIYEIEGAKKVAIEFKSYSKSAGFTGIRCGYTVVPKELLGYTEEGKEVSINKLWNRRQSTKSNGVSYITQRGAEAVYTEDAQKEIKENIKYYMDNAKTIKLGLEEIGFETFGGENAPYVWLKTPNGMKSWDFFDELLEKVGVVGTPGVGFGPSGEGYFRLTGFGTKENTERAIQKIKEYYS